MMPPDMPPPNIVYILADDLGYGDLTSNNPESRIPTPNLDRLAAGGMRFTDAHATSSVCTPSRYSILTGRYAWRSRLKSGIVWAWDAPLIEPNRPSVAGFLRDRGYSTACLGKWHLGWDWPTKDGRQPNETLPFGKCAAKKREEFGLTNIRYDTRIGGGPVDRGFDSYFGIDVPNFPPYAWFENDRLTEVPSTLKSPELKGDPGMSVPGWNHEAMMPEFTRRAVEMIERHGTTVPDRTGKPFFLFMALTAPHSPVNPNQEFLGRSGIGPYGDFVCEVDWSVGQVLDALERSGLSKNTLVIFTSDNGPENRCPDDEGAYERARTHRHYSMGPLRGIKRDAWEGGHRVPFIASWPGLIPAGTTCQQVVGLQDLFATCAHINGTPLPSGAAPDSVSILPLLLGKNDQPVREHLVHHSASGKFALRSGDWVLIDHPRGGDFKEPEWFMQERGYTPSTSAGGLFNLRTDPSQAHNLFDAEPAKVAELLGALDTICGPERKTMIPGGVDTFFTE